MRRERIEHYGIQIADIATGRAAPVVGRLAEGFIDRKRRDILYEISIAEADKPATYIEQMNTELLDGSCAVVMNHSHAHTNIVMLDIVRKLTHRKETGFFVSKKFWTGEIGLPGLLVLSEMKYVHIRPLRITQKQHAPEIGTRERENAHALRTAMEICSTPGGLFLFYPEGSRNVQMHEANPNGLTILGAKANALLPVSGWQDGAGIHAVVHTPVSGRKLKRDLSLVLGNHEWRQTFTDVIMTRIASAVPIEHQGFYQSFVATVNRLEELQDDQPRYESFLAELSIQNERYANLITGWDLLPEARLDQN